ncbi:MAG: hypothetical protein K6F55_11370, partial [Eubacterium sp.]|nr:hypothetical protein [Eubacterium sp.]
MERVNIETERQDLFDVSILIAMRFHISGNVSDDAIKNAFESAVRYHEILGTRVVLDKDGNAYYEKKDDINSNRITFEKSDWKDIIRREE